MMMLTPVHCAEKRNKETAEREIRQVIFMERVGCERCSDSAAPEMLCSRVTAKKY